MEWPNTGGILKFRADFHFFKRRGGKISSGVQATPLSELWKGLDIRVKDLTENRRGEAKFWWD
jgi:hypothetical protein